MIEKESKTGYSIEINSKSDKFFSPFFLYERIKGVEGSRGIKRRIKP